MKLNQICQNYNSFNRGGTRTRNFRMSTLYFHRSPTPYPLGHTILYDLHGYNIMAPDVHYSSEGIIHQYLQIRGDITGLKRFCSSLACIWEHNLSWLEQLLYTYSFTGIRAYVYSVIGDKTATQNVANAIYNVVKDKFPLLRKFLKYTVCVCWIAVAIWIWKHSHPL